MTRETTRKLVRRAGEQARLSRQDGGGPRFDRNEDRERRVRAHARRIRKCYRWRGDDAAPPARRVSEKRLTAEFVARAAAFYREGRTVAWLTGYFRASSYTVLAALHKAGLDTRRWPPWHRVGRACEVCGKSFTAERSEVERGYARACSWACRNELVRRKALARGRRRGRMVTCSCGRQFWAWRSRLARGFGRYCSLSCAGRYRRAPEQAISQDGGQQNG